MQKMTLIFLLVCMANAYGADEVNDNMGAACPHGGVVLLGKNNDLSQWRMENSEKEITWKIEDGILIVAPSTGSLITREKYTDFQLHLEFNVSGSDEGHSTGNSGVYIQLRYEVQILDSFGKEKWGGQDCGAIYMQKAADVNACRPAGEWQSFDIDFQAPRWDESGKKIENARITVVQNGIKIHDNVEVKNKTGAGKPEGPAPGPIKLQDHGNPIKFRNIWIVSGKKRIEREFYAFDNGLTSIETFEEKAAVLKELGYDGICWRPGARPGDMIEALDEHGLRMLTTYAGCNVDADNPSFDERLPEEIEAYKKHKTIIWLFLTRGKNANDEIAVKLIKEVAELAEKAGLKVVLYPHVGFYAATVDDALRLVKKADRPNVGMSFNLCHFLKSDDEKNLETVLRKSAPHLMLVSINGADSGDTKAMSWDRVIQPLSDGSFHNGKVLKILDEIGYSGPVSLQCYSIKGDDRENLKKSITAWRELKLTQKSN